MLEHKSSSSEVLNVSVKDLQRYIKNVSDKWY
jgi:hypothetical protein